MGHVKDPELHFLQQVPQVIVVEWQSTLTERNITCQYYNQSLCGTKSPPTTVFRIMSTNIYFSMVDS